MSSRSLKLVKGAKEGDFERVQALLLRKDVVVDEEDELGLTPLIWAAHGGHSEIVKALLEHGAKIDRRARNGATACHQAAFEGHFEVVDLLLKKGADPFIETDSSTNPPNVTPLEWATCIGQSNQKTRGLLKEAMDRFDEQERRVFRKYLLQSNLQVYEKVFTDHGFKMSTVKGLTDIDLRKMNITPDFERQRILRILRRKKMKEYREHWFPPDVVQSPVPLMHPDVKKRKGVPVSGEIMDPNIKVTVQRGLERLEGFLCGAAVTPKVGLFRIQEHVFFSLPSIVQSKSGLVAETKKAEGGTSDLKYAHEEIARLAPLSTFISIKTLLLRANDLALKIKQRNQELAQQQQQPQQPRKSVSSSIESASIGGGPGSGGGTVSQPQTPVN